MKLLSWMSFILIFAGPVHADPKAVHGMLVFGGETTLYASHLPMFHFPHKQQLIMKISQADAPHSHAVEDYALSKSQGKTLFTMEPEAFDLQKLVNGTLTNFSAHLYEGHFERGGKDLGKILVTVSKIVYSKKLDPATPTPTAESYLVFGENGDYFAAHEIQGKPSFDSILKVLVPTTYGTFPCRTRLCPNHDVPVRDNQLPMALVGPSDPQLFLGDSLPQLGSPGAPTSTVIDAIYIETGDLSM